MSAVDRALRHIEKLLAKRPARPHSAKAAPKPRRRAPKRPEPAQRVRQALVTKTLKFDEPYMPPRTFPDITEQLEATYAPPPGFELSITAAGVAAVAPLTDAEALKLGILPNGDVVDDWLDAPLPGWQPPWGSTG